MGLPVVNMAIMYWLKAARKAGGLLAKVEREQGTRKDLTSYQTGTKCKETLKENDLATMTAYRWQELAKIREAAFEAFFAKFKTEDILLSMVALLKLVEKKTSNKSDQWSPLVSLIIKTDKGSQDPLFL